MNGNEMKWMDALNFAIGLNDNVPTNIGAECMDLRVRVRLCVCESE